MCWSAPDASLANFDSCCCPSLALGAQADAIASCANYWRPVISYLEMLTLIYAVFNVLVYMSLECRSTGRGIKR
jgi:hypothetical protein